MFRNNFSLSYKVIFCASENHKNITKCDEICWNKNCKWKRLVFFKKFSMAVSFYDISDQNQNFPILSWLKKKHQLKVFSSIIYETQKKNYRNTRQHIHGDNFIKYLKQFNIQPAIPAVSKGITHTHTHYFFKNIFTRLTYETLVPLNNCVSV